MKTILALLVFSILLSSLAAGDAIPFPVGECSFQEGACCDESVNCQQTFLECIEGSMPVCTGCDENCIPICSCEPQSEPLNPLPDTPSPPAPLRPPPIPDIHDDTDTNGTVDQPPVPMPKPRSVDDPTTPLLIGGAIVMVIAFAAFMMLTRMKKK